MDNEDFDSLENISDEEVMKLFNDVVEGTENSILIARGGYWNGNFNYRYSGRWTTN